MDWQTALSTFTLIFITMGPIKVLIVYAEKTATLAPDLRRHIAIKAVFIASVIGLLFIVAGKFLMDLFKFSIGALTVAGGLILLIFAINMVLSEGEHREDAYSDREAEALAVYPFAMPLIASPMGIVVLTIFSATAGVFDARLLWLAVIFLVVMVIVLLSLLGEERILHFIPPEVLQVAERILGILLAAMAVQTIFNGLVELWVQYGKLIG